MKGGGEHTFDLVKISFSCEEKFLTAVRDPECRRWGPEREGNFQAKRVRGECQRQGSLQPNILRTGFATGFVIEEGEGEGDGEGEGWLRTLKKVCDASPR